MTEELVIFLPFVFIETADFVEREMAEDRVLDGGGSSTVVVHVDLGVPNWLAFELGMHFVVSLLDDPLKGSLLETPERPVVMHDVEAGPNCHEMMLPRRCGHHA